MRLLSFQSRLAGHAWACALLVCLPARAQVDPLRTADGGVAEGEDAVSAPSVQPPRLLSDPGVSYPFQALQEHHYAQAEVVLILQLDETGTLTHASVEAPQGHGFDEQALAAAQLLRFEPARRNGTPTAARIRYRYRFEPPRPPGPAEEPSLPRVDPPAPAPPPAIEVTVRGQRLEPSVASFTRAEVRKIPGAFGDPFRALEVLPGVTPLASGLPFFYLRGAPPGNVGYFLDGVRVPYLYHVGAGPAVVQPALIERVDLYAGGYPARFGRFAGGIVSASIRPTEEGLHGEGSLRLFDVGGLLEYGFDEGRGSALLGGRYSYTGALLSLAAPNIKLDYYDFQARLSYDISARDTLSVFSFGAYDLLVENGATMFGSEFYRADVRYDHRFDQGQLRVAVTLGYDRTFAGLLVPEDPRNVADRSIGARAELDSTVNARLRVRAGAQVNLDSYRVQGPRYSDPDYPQARAFDRHFPERIDQASGAWVDFALTLTPSLELVSGLRADLYSSASNSAYGVDPRLSARYAVRPDLRIVAAAGLAHQPPSFVLPLPGIAPVLGSGLQRSLQTAVGIESDLPHDITLGTTLFYHAFFKLSDALGQSGEGPDTGNVQRSRGAAFGAELFLRRRLSKRLGGLVSYTLSRSLRSVADQHFLSAFDRTHVANAALSYDLGRGFRLGARFLYYTGTPVWRGDGEGTITPALASRRSAWGRIRVARDDPYYRLDLRAEKRWAIRKTGFMSLVLEFLNVTIHKETWPGGEKVGPIAIPSLGLEAGF